MSHRNWVEYYRAPAHGTVGETVRLGRHAEARRALRRDWGLSDREALRALRDARLMRPYMSAATACGQVFCLDVI